MLCREVINEIEKAYPGNYAVSGDNVGLLAGRDDKKVETIYVAVDATDEVIEDAVRAGADMLVTHHPLIYGSMRQVNNLDFIGQRLIRLIQNDISYYAMHTNYDVLRMGKLAGERMHLRDACALEVTAYRRGDAGQDGPEGAGKTETEANEEGLGRIGELEEAVSLRQCAAFVKEAFSLEEVKVFGSLDCEIKRAAICPGSGKSVIGTAIEKGADVLVTGDIGHHEGIDAVAQGLCIIDGGHYGIEHIFTEDVKRYLEIHLDGVDIAGAPVKHPFTMV